MLVDSHCHLADEAFAGDLDAVIGRARDAGIDDVLCILSADEPLEIDRAEGVRRAWPAVRFAVGVHPHRAGGFSGKAAEAVQVVSREIDRMQALAVGEIGLDYHYDFAPRDVQRAVLEAQLSLAVERDLPVVVHTREASDDTFEVLRAAGPRLRGVIHCFTGTLEEARAALDAGFHISLAGIVTFRNAAELRRVAAFVPADRLLVETDAPFLAPVPHRGKRNEPAWIGETYRAVAAERGVPPEDLASAVAGNFNRLFLSTR